jgi:DNA-binding NtrC family response regulator
VKFMIITDHAPVAELASTALMIGWPDAQIMHASDALSGLVLAEVEEVDLVVADVAIFDVPGINMADRLEEFSHAAVISLTSAGYPTASDGQGRRSIQASLESPFDELKLIGIARSLLSTRASQGL